MGAPFRGEGTVLPPHLSPRRVATSRAPGLRRLGRALSWVAACTSVLMLVGAVAGYYYVNAQVSSIRSISGLCLANCADAPTELGETENFLIVGTDTRSGANSTGVNAGLAEGATGAGATYGNSDTTLLVHISASQQKVIVVSFPRDDLVTVPTWTNANGSPGLDSGQPAKFNAAYSLGGPALIIKQVEQLTGLPVDHFISVDFAGFQQMVDAVGGVTICLSQNAYDPGGDGSGGSGFAASAGVHTLNGVQALEYVRQRHGLPDGDLDRIKRQQRFISALIRKAKAPSVLLNPVRLNDFITAITSNITKDAQTSGQDLLGLAQRLRGLGTNQVEFLTVPTERAVNGTGPLGYLGDYLVIDSAKAHAMFQALHDDRDPSAPVPAVPPRGSASASASATPSAAASSGSPTPSTATPSASATPAVMTAANDECGA